MRHLLLFSMLSVITTLSLRAQTTVWQQIVPFPETIFVEDRGVDLAMLPGGDLLLLGRFDSTTNDGTSKAGPELARIGPDGTLRWSKRLAPTGNVTPVALHALSDTLYAISGWVEDSDTVVGDERMWVGLVDTSGSLTLVPLFPQIDMRVDQVKQEEVDEFGNRGFVVSGVGGGMATILITGSTFGFSYLRSFSRGDSVLGTAVAPSGNGGYLLVINVRDGDHIRPEVLGLDQYGDSLWSVVYQPESTEVWNDIVSTPDGGFIVAGTTGHELFDRFGNLTVTRFEPELYVQWRVDKKYWVFDGDSTGINEANRIVPLEDGRVMIVGSTGQGHTVPFLLELDRDGEETFQYITGPLEFSQSEARAIVPLSNDEFIVLGQKYLDMWVARVKREVSDVEVGREVKRLDLSDR